MLTRLKKQFLDLPIAQKFVSIFAVMTLLSCAVMVGALHLGLSVFEEKLYEKSLQELDFFVQRSDDDLQQMDVLTRSIAVDTSIQSQLAQLAAADPETAQYYYLLTGVRPLLLEKLYMTGQADALQYVDLNGNNIVVGQSFPDPGDDRRAALTDALTRTPGNFVLIPPDADYPYFICGREVLRSQNMSSTHRSMRCPTSRRISTFIIRKRWSTKAVTQRPTLRCLPPARAMPCKASTGKKCSSAG